MRYTNWEENSEKTALTLNDLLKRGFNLPLNDYPIFDENYRPILNKKIIDHFRYRYIGGYTPDRFAFYMRRKMNEIMPYYNQLYKSEMFDFSPLDTTDIKEYNKINRKTNAENAGKNSEIAESNRKNDFSEGRTFDAEFDYQETAKSDETGNTTGSKSKQGNYNKNGSETQSNEANTNQKITESTTSHSVTENDLMTVNESTNDSNGETTTTGSKSTAYSDLPQANIGINVSNGEISALNGENYTYLTTLTNETTTENSNTTAHQETDGTTKNTGTITVDGETSRNSTSDTTADETKNKLWNEDGTDSSTEDSTENSTVNKNTETTRTIGEKNRSTTDNQEFENIFNRGDRFNENKQTSSENMKTYNRNKGRNGFSPSLLIKQYRDIIINTDMLVISELETLFLGVYDY